MKTLLRLWRVLPMWFHVLAMRIYRPKFRASVAAIIFDEQGRILLFKHTYRKFEWGLPAGGLEYNEQPDKAIVREFYEETGMQIEIERLLTVVSAREDHNISMAYLCKIAGGEFKESHEISEIKYFPVNEMPAMMLTTEKELIKWAVKEIQR
ncbi:MAG: NUDIX domain-containing protein [Anaerolineales bacterium]|nr:NUDIX domain-containing protein [Anaerolineales bacterium]